VKFLGVVVVVNFVSEFRDHETRFTNHKMEEEKIIAFSGMAYALEFKASGMIDFDTVLAMNVADYFTQTGTVHALHSGIFQTWAIPAFNSLTGKPTNALDHERAYAYSRGLLRFDAIVDKNLSGTIYFEMDAFRWGGSAGWASTGKGSLGLGAFGGTLMQGSERNTMGVWTTDRAAIEVKNVYFDVGIPYIGIPVPMTVRIGAQPFGVRPQICVYSDGAGITGGIKAGPVTIIPMWAKIAEGLDWASDDADLYGIHTNAKLGTFTIGGYGLYYNMNTYPLAYPTGLNWTTSGAPWGTATSASYGLWEAGTMKSNMWWFGVYADGKAGPINLNVDFVYDWGKVKEKNKINSDGTGSTYTLPVSDVKYSGWATRLKLDFPWEKFNFGLVGMYATGADANKTSTGGLPGTSVANRYYASMGAPLTRKVDSYVTPPGSEQSPGANEAIVMYSCFNAAADGGTGIANVSSYFQMSRGGFGGTAFIKGYGSVKATPWYKITLQGLYIWDTTSHGNTFGTAVKNPTAAYPLQILKDDNDIGFELDLIQEIDIYKNLKGLVGFGYLWAGKALDVYNGAVLGTSPYIGRNVSPQNPWNVTTRLIYTF
jgi:hypothetical protein